MFEGVCVTTVILAPGACGGGLRAVVLDATSVASAASVASVARLPSCVPGGLILSAGIPNSEQRGPPGSSNVSLGPSGFPQDPIAVRILILYLS